MINPSVNPLIKIGDMLLRASGETQDAIMKRSGLTAPALIKWRTGKAVPNLSSFEAFLNAMGYGLKIVPREENRGGTMMVIARPKERKSK